MYGIPNMKLEKERVEDRVDLMRAEGVTFVTNCEIGTDITRRRSLGRKRCHCALWGRDHSK